MDSIDHRGEKPGKSTVSRRRFLYLAGLGLAGAASAPLLSACGQAAPASAPAGKATMVVKLQGVEPLSGPSAGYGQRVYAGTMLAVKEINDAGGFQDEQGNRYTLQVTKQDMANNKEEAIALFRQAASDSSILAQIGPINSVGFLPAIPLAAQLKLPLIGDGSTGPVTDWNNWAFRVNPVGAIGMPILVKTVVKKLGSKRIALLHDVSHDGQAFQWEVTKKTLQELGLQAVADPVYRGNDQDFSAQIATIKAANPDVIGMMAQEADASKIALQFRESGIQVPLFISDGTFLSSQVWDNSKGAIKGGYTWISVDLSKATGGLKKFLDDYAKANPDLPATSHSLYGYDATYTIVAAIKKAGSGTDREKFRQVMSNLDITTPLGTRITFKNPPHGENLNPIVTVIQINERGQYEVIPQ